MNSNNHITVDQINNDAEVIKKELVECRHYLHAHPELSFKEERTTHYIVNKLKNFGYTDIQIGFGPLKTGVMVEIGSGRPCVMLRADIDALPIQEQTGVEFCSQSKGVSHACGHDAHITNLLGVAKLLKKYENSIKGRVKLLFQPAEETLQGAPVIIKAGVIDDVDYALGAHIRPIQDVPAGMLCAAVRHTASTTLNIVIKGRGAHASRPHLGINAIEAAALIQTVVSREVSPLEPRLITVGTIHGGTATNVVPQEAMISGTLRAASENVVKFMGKRLAEVAEGTAKAHRCSTEYDLLINGPAVVNDSEMVAIVREAAADVLGTERVCDVEM
ncbi:MAG: amidohydrolase, partial [Sutterella sp. 54_7]